MKCFPKSLWKRTSSVSILLTRKCTLPFSPGFKIFLFRNWVQLIKLRERKQLLKYKIKYTKEGSTQIRKKFQVRTIYEKNFTSLKQR